MVPSDGPLLCLMRMNFPQFDNIGLRDVFSQNVDLLLSESIVTLSYIHRSSK